jgi:hypothetical protein
MCHVWGEETSIERCSEKSGGEEATRRPRCRWQYSIKTDLKGIEWEIHLDQARDISGEHL